MEQQQTGLTGFILWLLWIVIVTVLLASIAYLFVGGSKFFSEVNTPPVVVYRRVDNQQDIVSVNGSIIKPSACDVLAMDVSGDQTRRVLEFNIDRDYSCYIADDSPVPETFFTEFEGDESTEIKIKINSVEQEVIIK